jgi:DNA-binding CsgD family transcriptional regulator
MVATMMIAYREGASRRKPLQLWPGLVAGHLRLVEERVDSQRRYVVVENPPYVQPRRALTSSELDVVAHAARGLSTKLISYTLDLAPSTVSKRLLRAAQKIGASSRFELIRLAAMFTPRAADPAADRDEQKQSLTDAERDVLSLIQRGLSNEEIATMRARSVRTIANQVASLLRKTNSGSRRELTVRLLFSRQQDVFPMEAMEAAS